MNHVDIKIEMYEFPVHNCISCAWLHSGTKQYVANTFLPLFNNTNNHLWNRQLLRSRNIITMVTSIASHFSSLLAEGVGKYHINCIGSLHFAYKALLSKWICECVTASPWPLWHSDVTLAHRFLRKKRDYWLVYL